MNAVASSIGSNVVPHLTSNFSQLSLKDDRVVTLKESTIKLLQKTILLAGKMEQKRGKPVDGWHRRRLLLLTALALISRGCGLGTRLLHLDELVDVLSGLLCKVNSKIALNALNAGPLGLAKLAQDVRLAERLRALHAFKLRHRKAKQVVLLCASCSSLQPYLTLLDQKRAFFESQRHRAALMRQKQFETQMAAQKSKNAHLAAHLASLQDGSKQAFLAPYLHAWRCLLNFRLVRARTRRRFKVAIITRWRRSCRVGQIAGIFYGKKLKLRAFNSWFSKRFGLNRERALTTKLNEFIAKKRRRAMFTFSASPFDCSEKGLLRTWRSQFRFRIAANRHARRLGRQNIKTMQRFTESRQKVNQIARFYNEIRLLKNAFYAWFRTVIPDRLLFARAYQFTAAHRQSLKYGALSHWARKLTQVHRHQDQLRQQQHVQQLKALLYSLAKWRLLTKQHTARFIWTANFRSTEDLRASWKLWQERTRAQIFADTVYQRRLALSSLSTWRLLFNARQERRWTLFRGLKRWRHVAKARQATVYFAGQRVLRVLAANDAPSSSLSHALSCSPDQQCKLAFIYRWRSALTRLIGLELAGDGMILEGLKSKLKRWRLQTHLKRLPSVAPVKLATKMIRRLKRYLHHRQERDEELEALLMDYYTKRAWKLEAVAFGKWERLFQLAQLGKLACEAELKKWQAREKGQCLHRWQLQTALKIHQKCCKWTERQRVLNYWRQVGGALQQQRKHRILARSFGLWCMVLKQRRLQSFQVTSWRLWKTGNAMERWRSRLFACQTAASLATDFSFLVTGLAALRMWRASLANQGQKQQLKRPERSLKQPVAHLLKPKKISVPSLSNINVPEKADESKELTVAESTL